MPFHFSFRFHRFIWNEFRSWWSWSLWFLRNWYIRIVRFGWWSWLFWFFRFSWFRRNFRNCWGWWSWFGWFSWFGSGWWSWFGWFSWWSWLFWRFTWISWNTNIRINRKPVNRWLTGRIGTCGSKYQVTIRHLQSCSTIIEIWWRWIIPTFKSWRCFPVKDGTMFNILVIFRGSYFFSSRIIINTWIWNLNVFIVSNIYRLLVVFCFEFLLRCERNLTCRCIYFVWSKNVIFTFIGKFFCPNRVSITASRSIRWSRCCYWFFTNRKSATIPSCFLCHNLNWIVSRDSDISFPKVCFSCFNLHLIVFNAHWWTICIRIPCTSYSVAIFVSGFYGKGTWLISTIYIGSTCPVVKGIQSNNSVMFCQIKFIASSIVKFNIDSNFYRFSNTFVLVCWSSIFNSFVFVCWGTNSKGFRWVRTDFSNPLAIIWWKT